MLINRSFENKTFTKKKTIFLKNIYLHVMWPLTTSENRELHFIIIIDVFLLLTF